MKIAETLALEKQNQRSHSKRIKQLKKKTQSEDGSVAEKIVKKKRTIEQKRGLVFVGHIPHGFYETEMRNYFSQFGKVTNNIVCRSRKTGRSKGYGYVEFLHPAVAAIAASTMNNYIMFKRRLVAYTVSPEKRPKGLFNHKPVLSLKYRQMRQNAVKNKSITDEEFQNQTSLRKNRLQNKLKKLKRFGIEHSIIPADIPESVSIVTLKPKKESKNIVSSITPRSEYTYIADECDSDIEFKVSRIPLTEKKSKKSKTPNKKVISSGETVALKKTPKRRSQLTLNEPLGRRTTTTTTEKIFLVEQGFQVTPLNQKSQTKVSSEKKFGNLNTISKSKTKLKVSKRLSLGQVKLGLKQKRTSF